jgi:GT2 family glycosyltransferase
VTAVAPAVSVVVPSYNRRRSLEMVLTGLAAQQGVPSGAAEFIVVLDGSTDDSAELLTAWERDGRLPGLRWFRQANAGQAAARDAGSREAAAPVLLFLDDDVVPEPRLVACHLAHHAAGAPIAVLGDCEIVREPRYPAYSQHVWSWWEEFYSSRALAGRVPCYVDFCAGNVSLRRTDYLASGGFDPAFRGYGGEDYELGYRLLKLGVRFVADRRARALHYHEFRGYVGYLRAREQEGQADVLLARKHPELTGGLRLMHPDRPQPPLARAVRLAFTERGMADAELRARLARVTLNERLGRRGTWGDQLGLLTVYGYWRGVRAALGSRAALDALRAAAPCPVHTVDIGHPAPEVPPDFWVHGPSEVRVTARGVPLGTVRVPGPVLRPLRRALADAIVGQLSASVWAWAEGDGTALLPRREAAPRGRTAPVTPRR